MLLFAMFCVVIGAIAYSHPFSISADRVSYRTAAYMPIIETIDGFKFFFDADTWLMIRPSGTEPVLRTYAEASTQEKVFDILADTKATIL